MVGVTDRNRGEGRARLLFVATVLAPAVALGAVAATAVAEEARLLAAQREARRRDLALAVRDAVRERVAARAAALDARLAELVRRGEDPAGVRATEPEGLALDAALGLLAPAPPWAAREADPPPPLEALAPAVAAEAAGRPGDALAALGALAAETRRAPQALAVEARALAAAGRRAEALEVDLLLAGRDDAPAAARWAARERRLDGLGALGRAGEARAEARALAAGLVAGGGAGLGPGAWWITLEALLARLDPADVAALGTAAPAAVRLARAAADLRAHGADRLEPLGPVGLRRLAAGAAGGGDGWLVLGRPGDVRAALVVGGTELAALVAELGAERAGPDRGELEAALAGPGGEPGAALGAGLGVVVEVRQTALGRDLARRRALLRGAVLAALLLTIVGGSLAGARALRRAAELARLRADFVASVTHELRTPVTSIRAMAEVLALGKLDPGRQAEYFRAIGLEARRLGRRIEDALAAARLERGAAQEPRPEPVDLRAAVEAAAATLRPAADEAGLRLRLEVAPDLPPARVDPELLERALENLLDNALKHGRPADGAGGEVVVRAGLDGAGLAVTVEDQGPGIPPAERAAILEPFARGRGAAGTTGAGLGLWTVASIAAAHGGRVEVGDAPGGGASIVLRLPRWEPPA